MFVISKAFLNGADSFLRTVLQPYCNPRDVR